MSFDRLTAMRTFAAVAHSKSFSGGAKHLRMSTSAVSRKIADLEQSLGVRLIQRTTRRLQLTETGKNYLEGCKRILELLGDVEGHVIAAGGAPRGVLRIATQIATPPVARALIQFREQYPDVDIEFMRMSRPVDMLEEQFDVWIHAYGPIPAEHVARRLMPIRLVVAAAPDYLARHGTPTHPRQLAKHFCLVSNLSRESNPWEFQRSGETITVRLPGHFVSNEPEVLVRMANAGLGIVRLPLDTIAEDLQAGRLCRVLKGWTTLASLHASAVYPSARHVPPKVRAFIDLLVRNLDTGGSGRRQADISRAG